MYRICEHPGAGGDKIMYRPDGSSFILEGRNKNLERSYGLDYSDQPVTVEHGRFISFHHGKQRYFFDLEQKRFGVLNEQGYELKDSRGICYFVEQVIQSSIPEELKMQVKQEFDSERQNEKSMIEHHIRV